MEKQILKKLYEIKNPYTNNSLKTDKAISNFVFVDNHCTVNLIYLGDDQTKNNELKKTIIKIIKVDFKIDHLKFSFDPKPIVKKTIHDDLPNTKVISIMSGKGGVGKSKLTTLIAEALNSQNFRVGIIDCDIYGYSIPKILNLYDEPEVVDKKIIPLNYKGIQVLSSQYFIENNANKAIIWRGPMVNKMLRHFFFDVKWSQLDFLLIDMPPGTGDVALTLQEIAPKMLSIIVSTPDDNATHVAIRSAQFARSLNIPIIGFIENMSYYLHNGEKIEVYGPSHLKTASKKMEIPIIAKIPFTNLESQESLQNEMLKILKKIQN